MPEPFKNFFNPEIVGHLADALARRSPGFDRDRFFTAATSDFDRQELKERSNAIRDALADFLPRDFEEAAAILCDILHPEHNTELTTALPDATGIRGWAVMSMAEFIALKGLDHFDLSMEVLRQMTSRFSAEFAVRPFLAADPDRALRIIEGWVGDANYHVRRLASEGTRPRLPWGMRLHGFVNDPAPLLPILTSLRDDPEDYVRRSVANSLNDIAKDHPDLVADLAAKWMDNASPARQKLIRHACRSLIKAGHPATMTALGYGPAEVAVTTLDIGPDIVAFGTALPITLALQSTGTARQDLILDYIIHHQKADGTTSPKVLKWKVMALDPGETCRLRKAHKFVPITTRVYYPGAHRLDIQVNGVVLGGVDFTLDMGSGQDRAEG